MPVEQDVLLKAVDSSLTTIRIDGVTYQADEAGNFSVPEGKLHRVLDLGKFRTPTMLTNPQLAALEAAGRVDPGACFFSSDLNKPIWRSGPNDAWVDAAGEIVTLS